MPSNLSFLDTNIPQFSDEDSTDKKIKVIQDYLYQTIESLRYALSHLNAGNMEQKFIESIVQDDGSIAQIKQQVNGNTASIDILSAAQATQGQNIAAIKETADENTSCIDMIVENVGDDGGVVNAASIAMAINSTTGQSKVAIDADHIEMTGTTTFLSKSQADTYYDASGAADGAVSALETSMASGSTVIDGGCITTDTIALNNIKCKGTLLTVKKGDGTVVGYLGEGVGKMIVDGVESNTDGVVLISPNSNYYVICTSSGVRMQAGTHSMYVTENGCYADGVKVGSAVWGS